MMGNTDVPCKEFPAERLHRGANTVVLSLTPAVHATKGRHDCALIGPISTPEVPPRAAATWPLAPSADRSQMDAG